jgi:Ca2+-binding EF-hand superfamily protein
MKITIIIIAFLCILTGNAYAQTDAFEKADLNKDGYISRDEYDTAVNSKFNEYDANKDGVVDKHEFNTSKDHKAAIEYEFLDRNKDGKVNMDEFKAGAMNRYNMYDQNRDNLLGDPEYRGDTGFPILKLYF